MISRPFALSLLAGIALASPLAAQPMANADTNNDGKVSLAEHAAMSAKRFDRLDANHDGVIDAGEITGAKILMMARGPGGKDPFAAMDANHDGKITRTEFDAYMTARFERADTNHDGSIDAAEREAMHRKP